MSTSHRPHAMDCEVAAELLPWLINGSLEADEKGELLEHVSACESCAAELEEAGQAWELVTRHVPSLALAEYGLGVEPESLDRVRIERHLAACPRCRRELEGIRSDRVLDFQEAGRSRAGRSRPGRSSRAPDRGIAGRRWAMAAGLAGALLIGGLLATYFEIGFPKPANELVTLDEGRVDPGEAVASFTLFQDGFESGSASSWSITPSDEQPIRQ